MRIWSIHPSYLDSAGINGCWRESLLAQKILNGHNFSYKNHSQMKRFYSDRESLLAIGTYLYYIYLESVKRNYNYDFNKILYFNNNYKMQVTENQLLYEFNLLQWKLKKRNYKKYLENKNIKEIFPNNIFDVKEGQIESWEKICKINYDNRTNYLRIQ